MVRVQHARIRDQISQDMPLGALMARCEEAFCAYAGTGTLIDQAFARRIDRGIIRCYLVQDRPVDFARPYPGGLAPGERLAAGPGPDPRAIGIMGLPSGKTMYGPAEPSFQRLRRLLEQDWLPSLQTRLGIAAASLPALWDADFLFGPQTAGGRDTYILCEINASSVLRFPAEAPPELARVTRQAVITAQANR